LPLDANPFVVLSYVTGPALLTNATSLILLSTTNRFARAIDRSRQLTDRLISPAPNPLHEVEASELRMVGRRIKLIGRAIAGFYLAAAMFALATVISILGSVLVELVTGAAIDFIVAFTVIFGLIGFAAFVAAAFALVLETRLTMGALAFESAAAIAAMDEAMATRKQRTAV
jgi:hypothetical protein